MTLKIIICDKGIIQNRYNHSYRGVGQIQFDVNEIPIDIKFQQKAVVRSRYYVY